MKNSENGILELLEYLEEMINDATKIPIAGKVMIDKKEFLEIIDQITHYLPDKIKKAEWVMMEKNRILTEAQNEYDVLKKETMKIMKQNVENHDIVREAKLRANEIIALAQRDAKAIRLGSREYSNEILGQLDRELEIKKNELIESMQISFEKVAKNIDENISNVSNTIKENIAELRNM